MAFYGDVFAEWTPSVEYFGKSLQRFHTPEEAIIRIDSFLEDQSDRYIKYPPYSDKCAFEELFKLRDNTNKGNR